MRARELLEKASGQHTTLTRKNVVLKVTDVWRLKLQVISQMGFQATSSSL